MKIEKKIELWLKDEKFVAFANERATAEMNRRDNHVIDPNFEEAVLGFDDKDEYIVPMVEYLQYKLHMAKLCKNQQKRERAIWWVWAQVKVEAIYVKIFEVYYAPLLKELDETIFPMLRREYEKSLQANKRKQ